MTAPTPGTPATAWPTGWEAIAFDLVTRCDDERLSGSQLMEIRRQVAAREAAAERRGAEKELRAAAACLDNDDEVAVWLRNRADFVADSDTIHEGDPR